MKTGDTIAAIASGPTGGGGHGARRALIRISGPVARELVEGRHAVFSLDAIAATESTKSRESTAPPARGVGAGQVVIAPGLPGVRVLAAWFGRGASYTGEATLELVVPGGGVTPTRVLGALCGVAGVRHALAGEFTARAYELGRLTLAQAEGVAAVIASETSEQVDAARSVLSGAMGRVYESWAERITRLRALVEAGIDFAEEEDVVAIEPRVLRERCAELVAEMDARLQRRAGGERVSGAARVVLVGLPNAGKSTLFNALLGRRRAITSPMAGTTRDALCEMMTVRGSAGRSVDVELVDIAGLGHVGGEGESSAEPREVGEVDLAMREAAEREIGRASVILWCDERGGFDASKLGVALDVSRVIRVRTKRDRPGGGVGDVGVSAIGTESDGLGSVRGAVFEAVWRSRAVVTGMDLLPRHAGALVRCRDALSEVVRLIEGAGGSLRDETLAEELASAGEAIGEMTGRVERDDVLGLIFSTFCIGK